MSITIESAGRMITQMVKRFKALGAVEVDGFWAQAFEDKERRFGEYDPHNISLKLDNQHFRIRIENRSWHNGISIHISYGNQSSVQQGMGRVANNVLDDFRHIHKLLELDIPPFILDMNPITHWHQKNQHLALNTEQEAIELFVPHVVEQLKSRNRK